MDITRMSNQELRKKHGVVVSWLCYRMSQLSHARVALLDVKEKLARKCATLDFMSGKDAKWKLDYMLRKDDEWMTLQDEYLRVEARVVALEMSVSSLEKKSMLLSRDQSMREMEMRQKT